MAKITPDTTDKLIQEYTNLRTKYDIAVQTTLHLAVEKRQQIIDQAFENVNKFVNAHPERKFTAPKRYVACEMPEMWAALEALTKR